MRQIEAVTIIALAAILSGCVGASDRLLTENDALADSYFTGKFRYEFLNKQRNINIYLKERRYLIEEDGKLTSFATLHSFKDDLFVVQSWNIKAGGADLPYLYYLLRKTPGGFELDGEICERTMDCKVVTRDELTHKLEVQAKAFRPGSKSRVEVRRL